MNPDIKIVKGYLFLLLSAVCSSLFVLFYREVSRQESSINSVFLLYFFATLFSTPWFVIEKSWKARFSKRTLGFIILVAVSSILGNYFSSISVRHITPSVSQMIQRTDIFFGVLYGMIVFNEKLRSSLLISLFFCSIGVLIIFYEFWETSLHLWSVFSGILTAFFFSTMQFCTKMIIKEASPNVINFWRLLISLIVLLFFAKDLNFSDLSFSVIMFAALSAFVGPFGARMLINYSTKYVPFSAISIVTAAAPIMTFFLQYLFLGIVLTEIEIIGSLMILGSVLIIAFYKG